MRIVTLHEVVVDGILENLLAAVAQEHLFLGNAVDFTQADADDALLSLVVDTGIEAERAGIKVLYGLDDLL